MSWLTDFRVATQQPFRVQRSDIVSNPRDTRPGVGVLGGLVRSVGDQLGLIFPGDSGLLVPRLTTAQRDQITPGDGEVIWNLDESELQVYRSTSTPPWRPVALRGPRFSDFSVNAARAYTNQDDHLVLESSISTNSAGNFNGGGTGNKPIVGVRPVTVQLEDIPVADFPRLQLEVLIHTTDERGVSYNAFVDLVGNGNPADIVVVVITSTLNGVVDKYGRTSGAATITDFDISSFAVRTDTQGNAFVSGGQSLDNAFYVVGNLPSYTGALPWFSNPVNLDILLSGGVMPLTGEVFVGGFPDAVLVGSGYVATDGGLPNGTPVTPLVAQIADSGNNLRLVTEITDWILGAEVLI